jgi:hypothetical protein
MIKDDGRGRLHARLMPDVAASRPLNAAQGHACICHASAPAVQPNPANPYLVSPRPVDSPQRRHSPLV